MIMVDNTPSKLHWLSHTCHWEIKAKIVVEYRDTPLQYVEPPLKTCLIAFKG